MEVSLNNHCIFTLEKSLNIRVIQDELQKRLGIKCDDYYLLVNGKLATKNGFFDGERIHVVPRLCGGKGGFGSMLRAIGAQIEKTTNREACRDLSGRRLRDINEEQRLKNWIAAQAEREKEAAERKQKKLERLCQLPKHEFRDEQYDKERSELPEKVVDAVEHGLKVASATAVKRKKEINDVKKKKKLKLWVDAEVEDELSSSDEDSGSESNGNSSGSDVSKKDPAASCSSDSKLENENSNASTQNDVDKEQDKGKCEKSESFPEKVQKDVAKD